MSHLPSPRTAPGHLAWVDMDELYGEIWGAVEGDCVTGVLAAAGDWV